MIRINLLPSKTAAASTASGASVLELAVILFLIAAGGAVCYFLWSDFEQRLAEAQKKINEEQEAINRLASVIKIIEEHKKKKENLEQQLGIIESLKNSRQGPVRVLDEISIRIPKQVWIENVQQRGGKLAIQGEAESNEIMTNFMRTLESSPIITDVELLYTNRTEGQVLGQGQNVERIKFSLTCRASFAS